MKKKVIVSLADANYFPLLEELINSIKKFKESENISNSVAIEGDVTNEDSIKNALDIFNKTPDLIVNNAGTNFPEHFTKVKIKLSVIIVLLKKKYLINVKMKKIVIL